MKKALLLLSALLLSIFLSACTLEGNAATPPIEPPSTGTPQDTDVSKDTVSNLILEFGEKLKTVSLLAPQDILEQEIKENYGSYVSPELLTKWQNDPLNAPGRLTSSPWPERIEILSVEKVSADAYSIKGEIVEITSTENPAAEVALRRPITLVAEKIEGRWLINNVELGEYEDADTLVYENKEYGFRFNLPGSWEGYTIITGKWEGLALGGKQDQQVIVTGPLLSIRHPEWTTKTPRQDIPILVFTLDQWNQLLEGKFHIGAAPIGPKELDRNSNYVFALPARYNYAFPEGFEEVERILEGNPLQAE